MTAESFIDTNVLLYAASGASVDQPKRRAARSLLARPGIGFSAQVLQEFYHAAVCKKRLAITHTAALAILAALAPFPVLPVTRELVLAAADIRERHRISYWDAAIVAAARDLGCHTLYSEDLNPGQEFDGVRVVNPFA
jgi:predicted nucleic acid-binding protein